MQLHGERPIRHGFSAVGVHHGQSGGYHTGPCPGTRFPHLGISPEGTQWALDNARGQLTRAEDRLSELAANPDLIWYPRLRGSYNKAPGGLPDTTRPVILRHGADAYANDGRPTYASEHRRKVAEQTGIKDSLEAAIAEYERVIARWSPGKYPTTGAAAKVEIVHMERPVKTARGEVIGTLCRGVGRGRGPLAAKTCDPAKVTCKRCRTALGLPPV
jgi:hypothetical protein